MKRIILAAALAALVRAANAAEIVVIASPASPSLTKEQVSDVFLGKSQAAVPLDLPESSATRTEFYKRATGRDLAQVKSTWSRIVFTGKGQPPKEFPDAAAIKKAVAADPKAVGYIEKSAVDSTVKVILSIGE